MQPIKKRREKEIKIIQPLQICIGPTICIGQESCLPYAGFFWNNLLHTNKIYPQTSIELKYCAFCLNNKVNVHRFSWTYRHQKHLVKNGTCIYYLMCYIQIKIYTQTFIEPILYPWERMGIQNDYLQPQNEHGFLQGLLKTQLSPLHCKLISDHVICKGTLDQLKVPSHEQFFSLRMFILVV